MKTKLIKNLENQNSESFEVFEKNVVANFEVLTIPELRKVLGGTGDDDDDDKIIDP